MVGEDILQEVHEHESRDVNDNLRVLNFAAPRLL